jgi:hypothetical protein
MVSAADPGFLDQNVNLLLCLIKVFVVRSIKQWFGSTLLLSLIDGVVWSASCTSCLCLNETASTVCYIRIVMDVMKKRKSLVPVRKGTSTRE